MDRGSNHLQSTGKYKLKGTGNIFFHIDCDYFSDKDSNLCYTPQKQIEKLINDYVQMFGKRPKFCWSLLEYGDHPEIDTSEELNETVMKQFQSMIESLQWAISLGIFDISTEVMILSSF